MVEPRLADYFDCVTPDKFYVPELIVHVINNRGEGEDLPLVQHPMIVSQFYKLDDLELKYSINEALTEFDKLLKAKNPYYYRFLPNVAKGYGAESVHFYRNRFPVRAVLSYSSEYQCYVLSLDTVGIDADSQR